MECNVLGPVEVLIDSRPVDLGGPRQQLIVAGLLFHTGRVVTVADLVELVWDDDPPVTARKQLQTAVYRIRRFLGHDGSDGPLRTDQAGYRLIVPEERLDLARFRVALSAARSATAVGDLRTAAATYRDALDQWRGTPFAGLPGTVVGRWRDSLVELRWAATEEWAEATLALGRHRDLIEAVAPPAAGEPLRERLAATLMAALHRDGRQAEALQVYRRTADALRDELGVDPGQPLQDQHLEVLRRAPTVLRGAATVLRGAATAEPVSAAAVSGLPRPVARLRGRRPELDRLVSAVRDGTRIVVIDGMAGVGKSTFAVSAAQALADEFPDAQLYVDLRGTGEAAPVAPADALGLLLAQLAAVPQRIPDDLPGRQVAWRRLLTGRRVVVVLDNAAGASQVAALLPGDTPCLVLVTSRTRIGPVDGALPFGLEPLPVQDAVTVLRDAVGDRVDAEPAAAAAVVELCGRLPLAIRLVAHRLQHRPRWSVSAMLDRLRAADPPAIAVAAEGRSVAAAFDVSYRQLSEPERRLFRRLGLHPAGEFEVWPAAALAGLDLPQARELLERLVEVHLLQEEQPGHFRLHDLMREFAASLVTAQERAAALPPLLDYYVHTVARVSARQELYRTRPGLQFAPDTFTRPFDGEGEELAWMRAAWPTVVALADEAHGTGAHRHAAMLFRASWTYSNMEARSTVADRLGRQALASARALGDDELIAVSSHWYAGTLLRIGRGAESLRRLEEAAAHYEAAGHTSVLPHLLINMGIVCRFIGRLREGQTHLAAALDLALAAGDVTRQLHALTYAGSIASALGEHEVALNLLRRATLGMRLHVTGPHMMMSLAELGRTHLGLGHPRLAALLFARSRKIKSDNGNVGGAAEALSDLGRAHAALGALDEALRCQLKACDEIRDVTDWFFEAVIRNDLGGTLTLLGRTDEALVAHRLARERAEATEQRYEQARAHAGSADALRRAGRDDTADRAAAYRLFVACGLTEAQALRSSRCSSTTGTDSVL